MNPSRFSLSILLLLAAALPGCGGSKGTKPAPGPLELSSNVPALGGQYSHRFFAAGAYPYHCSIHPSMTGSVVVSNSVPAGDSLQGVTITSFAFTSATASIPVGGVVTWTNTSSILHTVTSN